MIRRLHDLFSRTGDSSDAGAALIIVIIFGMVLMMLVATASTVSLSGLKKSSTESNWNAALDAAYAGIEDYKSELSGDPDYVNYVNPSAPFSSSSTGTLPPTTNPAFGIGTTGAWASVPTDTGATASEYYRYEVDNSEYDATGVVRILSTGKVGDSVRSLLADVRQDGFIDFVYFTDYEIADPNQSSVNCTVEYAWQLSSPYEHPSDCEIEFTSGDVLNGPVHSNDSMDICGATFTKAVTTGDDHSPYYVNPGGCAASKFEGGAPTPSGVLAMPPSNANMKLETRTDLPTTVQRPGCLYTGPTNIVFNKNGTMTVVSPFTRFTEVSGDGNPNDAVTSGTNPPMCGTPGTATGDLGSSAGETLPVVPENLIFVQNVPTSSTQTNDPNYWKSGTYPSGFKCVGYTDTGKIQQNGSGWTFGSLAYPMAKESVPPASPAHYGCVNGDAYVQGALNGAVTVASDNYIYITGDLTYSTGSSTNILGLVGNNAVWVWNPMQISGSTTTPLLSGTGRTIDAAILSVQHTFEVQNYGIGPKRGTLTVMGAIAQKFRGAVGTSGGATGYLKSYNYDTRFATIAPPKFLSPETVEYGVTTVEEVPAAFNADGSAG
jgi:Tfp pilus assembly protein PilX